MRIEMNAGLVKDIIRSWKNKQGVLHTNTDILQWISELNQATHVEINEISIHDSSFWFYDDYNGEVLNRKRSFFSIKGLRQFINGRFVNEQPIIIQPEIGYLGIICKKIDGVLCFLMQAKIEPGNANNVQLSPTIQATKSNFTRVHGGKLPDYFTYFEDSARHQVIYDQIQSEQGSRFYQKRNRNMIMLVEEEIDILPHFRWVTLGQLKEFLKIDNLVNMDTRTVLSGLNFIGLQYSEKDLIEIRELMDNNALFASMFTSHAISGVKQVNEKLNHYKMFHDVTNVMVPLNQLVDWEVTEFGIVSRNQMPFMVKFYDIAISGREVSHWDQPLFCALGQATIGLFTRVENGVRQYLVKLSPEIGCFDKIELGPTVHWEPTHYLYHDDCVEKVFRNYLDLEKNIMTDVLLSEEGGRFYHEQNRNLLIELETNQELELTDEYIWLEYAAINFLIQSNNVCNIQLRNLISLIDL